MKNTNEAKDRKALQKMAAELHEVVARIQALYALEDYATGHAFVVFQYEKDRNKFIKLARTPAKAKAKKGSSTSAVAPEGRQLSRSARPDVAPEVCAAPEPGEVVWESLELDDAPVDIRGSFARAERRETASPICLDADAFAAD